MHTTSHALVSVASPWSLAVIAAMTATKRPSVGVTVGLSLIGAATQQLRQRAPDLTVGEARKSVIRGPQATATALGRAIRRVCAKLNISARVRKTKHISAHAQN